MKFSTYLVKIAGITVYPLVSLLLFVAFFAMVFIYAMKIDKKEVDHMKNIPLD